MPYMIGSNKKINRSRVHLASAFSVQKNGTSAARSDMVPVAGVEPARYRYHWILSPARLPIPSHRRIGRYSLYHKISKLQDIFFEKFKFHLTF